MPARVADDNGRVARGIVCADDLRARLAEHFVLDGAAFAVLLIEQTRERLRAGRIIGEQQFQRGGGGVESACRIQPRADAEADVHRAEWRAQARDFDQCAHARPARLRDAIESGADEDAVLLHERHHVGDRADGGKVEKVLDVEAGERAAL